MKNDGGPAFPKLQSTGLNAMTLEISEGMTLRDYFAAAALQGFCANSYNDGMSQPLSTANAEQMSELAYRQADAMLAERGKSNQ